MYMYAMRQNSVLKGMGARFKIYMPFFPVSYLGLSALLPVFDTKLCVIARTIILLWIESMPAIASHVLHKAGGGWGGGGWGGGGGGWGTIPNGKEGGRRTSFTFIGRLMPLEIVVNRAIVYSLNTIPLCYKCIM